MTAEVVDKLLRGPAIVFGSLPPEGRDLDLLLSSAEYARLREDLIARGWVGDGRTFASFSNCSAYAVDLVTLDAWSPNPRVASRLLSSARPVPGYVNLRAPSPHHQLLILARRRRGGMALTQRKRRLLQDFSDSDWGSAANEAPEWGLEQALNKLRYEHENSSNTAQPSRSPARRVRPKVVSLSGLDGSGKTTHAEHLRVALEALGYSVDVEWSKIARDPVLRRLAGPLRVILDRLPVPTAVEPLAEEGDVTVAEPAGSEVRNYPDGSPPLPAGPARRLRERSRVVTWGWTLIVAWANGLTHRRVVHRDVRDVVICDRYVLDSMAHLRYRYGRDHRYWFQDTLIRILSPRPTCSIFLDVAPGIARSRKPEQYTTSDLERLRQCYLEAVDKLPVVVINPDQPVEKTAAEIGRIVFAGLSA